MLSWYALHVRHQCEQLVETALAGHCETFWPHRTTRTSNGRQKAGRRIHRRAWFPGYMFVRADWTKADHRGRVLGVSHVLGILGTGNGPIAIPDQEIESLRTLMTARAGVIQSAARAGQRVVVTSGPFRGVEGIVARIGNSTMLVVQIELLGRGVAVQLPNDVIEVKNHHPLAA